MLQASLFTTLNHYKHPTQQHYKHPTQHPTSLQASQKCTTTSIPHWTTTRIPHSTTTNIPTQHNYKHPSGVQIRSRCDCDIFLCSGEHRRGEGGRLGSGLQGYTGGWGVWRCACVTTCRFRDLPSPLSSLLLSSYLSFVSPYIIRL